MSNDQGKTRRVRFSVYAVRLERCSRSFWPSHPSICEIDDKYSRQATVPAVPFTCLCMCLGCGFVCLNIPGLVPFTCGKKSCCFALVKPAVPGAVCACVFCSVQGCRTHALALECNHPCNYPVSDRKGKKPLILPL